MKDNKKICVVGLGLVGLRLAVVFGKYYETVGFDELNDPDFPGETVALRETLGLNNVAIQRCRFSGMQSYVEF